jgi:hypothetical protein
MLQKSALVDKCNSQFQLIFGENSSHDDGKIILAHFGEFSQDLLNSLTTNVEEQMLESGDKKSTIKRMFSILVEGLQNIRIHAERDSNGNQVSFLLVLQQATNYRITFGNLVSAAVADKLTKRIDQLNSLSHEDIKTMYMDTLSNGTMSAKGGAGLGFITISLKTNAPIEYQKEPVSADLFLFTQVISIDRV